MNTCPVCRGEVNIEPPDWSGGRVRVDCSQCGSFEIGSKLIDELKSLPIDHWQIDLLKEGLANAQESVKITKDASNIAAVEPSASKRLTKLEKRSLRAKAEGKSTITGQIFYNGDADQ